MELERTEICLSLSSMFLFVYLVISKSFLKPAAYDSLFHVMLLFSHC